MARKTITRADGSRYKEGSKADPNFSGGGGTAVQERYQKRPEESTDEYNTRASGYYDKSEGTKVRRYTSEDPLAAESPDFTLDDQDAEEIRRQTAARMQGQIGAIESVFAGLIKKEEAAGVERLGRTRSIGARGGLAGSARGQAQQDKTQQFTDDAIKTLEAEKAMQVAGVLDRIDQRATEEIQAERARLAGESEKYNALLKERRVAAREDFDALAAAGVQLDELDPADITDLMRDTGYKNKGLFEAVYNSKLPNEAARKYSYLSIGNGRVVRTDDAGGAEVFDFGVPEGYEFRMAGDTPVVFNPRTGAVQSLTVGNESEDAPTFDDWLKDQNLSVSKLSKDKLDELKVEYDRTYASGAPKISEKVSPDAKRELDQAGLKDAPDAVKNYFINTPAGFQDEIQRRYSLGEISKNTTIDDMNQLYEEWYAEQQKDDGSGRSWEEILGE